MLELAEDVERHIADRQRERILVVSNCQTPILVNSMRALCREVGVDGLTLQEFGRRLGSGALDLAGYRHVLMLPEAERLLGDAAGTVPASRLPAIVFRGFHPDSVLLIANGTTVNGPMLPYHSFIAFAAYAHGLDPDATRALYTRDTFDALGYFDGWTAARAMLFDRGREAGLDLEAAFYRWCGRGCFMHTVNHPKAFVLADVAGRLLARLGLDVEAGEDLVTDTLINAGVFPVYDEIASHLGFRGSYLFRLPRSPYTLDLAEFIDLSFRNYAGLDLATVTPGGRQLSDFDAVIRRH